MPVLKLYRHGLTAGIPPRYEDEDRPASAKRGKVQGWSKDSTRSNTRFLYGVEEQNLNGYGYALSLTVRDCPPTSEDFHAVRGAFSERLRRMDLIRMHWLIEWQRRRVPHLHMAIWLPYRGVDSEIIEHWCKVAGKYGAKKWGQYVEPIHDSVGWFKYLSKHASRGISHYQRSPESIPKGWERTGRMWGHRGDWPVRESMNLTIDHVAYYRLRRIVKRWRIGDARRAIDQAEHASKQHLQGIRRLHAARRMLRASSPDQSRVRGISEWMPLDDQLRAVAWLKAGGCSVSERNVIDTGKDSE